MSGLRSGKYEPRWTYASGFRTQHAALDAVEEFYACGLIDETDDPDIEYVGGNNPWIVTLKDKM
jgi:hypothetical protein